MIIESDTDRATEALETIAERIRTEAGNLFDANRYGEAHSLYELAYQIERFVEDNYVDLDAVLWEKDQ